MKYIHIPTGVEVSSDVELPAAIYRKVEKPARKPVKKPARKPEKEG